MVDVRCCSPDADRHQGRWRGLSELDQGSQLQHQHHDQGQHTAGPHTAVLHRLKTTLRAGGQTIGRVHHSVVMQPAAEPDAEGDHHGRRSAHGPAEPKQSPAEQGLYGTDHQTDPGGESGNALEPW